MRATFYIHIGVHKTGTKSIQYTFADNRDTLLKHGVNYLEGDPNHGPTLISLVTDFPHEDIRNLRRRVDTPEKAVAYNKLARYDVVKSLERNRSPKVVISGEGLSTRKPWEIERLKELLAPYAEGYRIIVYVRDPYEYASSAYLQRLKYGGILEIPSKRFPIPRYRRNLPPWIEAFGRENVDIRIFDPKRLVDGDLITDFLVAIGERPELVKELKAVRANQSMSHEAALILSETNKELPEIIGGQANPARSFHMHLSIGGIKGEKFSMKPAEYLPHEIDSLAEIDWVNRTVGEPVFRRREPRPASTPKWSDETIESIKRELGIHVAALRNTRSIFFRIDPPALPAGLEWLADTYYGKAAGKEAPAKSPEFNPDTIRKLGRLFNDINITLEHRRAERRALHGSPLVYINPRLAEDHFREVVRLNPACARGQYRLSQALLLRGYYRLAHKAAETAVSLAPKRISYRLWLGVARMAERYLHKPESEPVLPSRRELQRARRRAERLKEPRPDRRRRLKKKAKAGRAASPRPPE